MLVNKPGRRPTKLEVMVIRQLLEKDETFIIHHISESTHERLQLEIEDRSSDCPTFYRMII